MAFSFPLFRPSQPTATVPPHSQKKKKQFERPLRVITVKNISSLLSVAIANGFISTASTYYLLQLSVPYLYIRLNDNVLSCTEDLLSDAIRDRNCRHKHTMYAQS